MRVIQWAESYWPTVGGLENLLERLVPALIDRGHESIIISNQLSPHLPRQERHGRVEVHRFPFLRAVSTRDVALFARIRRELSDLFVRFPPDLVHLHDVGASALFLMSQRQANGGPAPAARTAVTLHCVPAPLPVEGEGLLGQVLQTADWVTGVSAAAVERARTLAPDIASRSSLIYNGLPAPAIEPSPLPFDPPLLLCLGRVVRGKGYDLAVSAMPAVLERCPTARLLISGDGPERAALRRQADDLGVGDAVELPGWVDATWSDPLATWRTVNRATMLLMPSRPDGIWQEGFGLSALQAMMMGRPVVAARTGGLVEVVVDNQTGLLVATDDADALAGAVGMILEHPDKARRLGQGGRDRAAALFDWERDCVGRYDALYRRLRP
ncbi:MAG: D-inositol-3-phosphate glycosyltransferase [Phycisphaerae bacterium]|nr:D-inositol-3-phosphate glycosyltransferase [Phycisphaerae bacterium]